MDPQEYFDTRVRDFVAAQTDSTLVSEWVDRIVSRIFENIPAMATDKHLAATVRRSAESQWVAFLASMDEPEAEIPMVPSASEMAIEIARRGRTLQELFQVYGVARRGVWEYITGLLAEQAADADSTAFLIFFWDRASHWIDTVAESSAVLYEDERDQVRLGVAAQTLETVREILEHRAGGNSRDVSAALNGYPISGYNTAMILTASRAEKVSELRSVALTLANSGSVRNPLIVSPGGRDLWVWLGTVREPSLEQLLLAKPELSERGIRVAVGAPGEGLEGFRDSHDDALHVQKIADVARDVGNPLYFPDVETLVMLWQSGEQAERFARRTLGGLGKNTDAMARLRQTARAALRAGSVEKAADMLVVHKNTVRYRLSQVEQVLGRGLHDAPIPLALALDYHQAFLTVGSEEAPE